MSGWARPDVKCVCVDNTDHPELVIGATYTVVSVRPFVRSPDTIGRFVDTSLVVRLAEVCNWSLIPDFAVERFRPLITRTQEEEQDLEWFLPLLKTKELVE